jgi:hypothetical protein
MSGSEIVSLQDIESKIYTVRGMQVMIDEDLALLYGVETKRINEQVKRNIERFPDNFCFRLSSEDISILKSQNATSNSGYNYMVSQNAIPLTNSVCLGNLL